MIERIESRDGTIKLEKIKAIRRPKIQTGRSYEKIRSCHCSYVSPDLLAKISSSTVEQLQDHLNNQTESVSRKEVTLAKAEKYLNQTKETLKLMSELEKYRDYKIKSISCFKEKHQAVFEGAFYQPDKKIKLYDAKRTTSLPGWYMTPSQIASSQDPSFKRLWKVSCDTAKFYFENFQRDSFDGSGSLLKITDNYGVKFDNAYWDGVKIVFGRGDGKIFGPFSSDNNVYIHENGHAVVQETVNLVYQDQAGALNESFADVFGKAIEKQLYNVKDWKVGDVVLLGPGALRDMEHPGTAYNEDQQPLLGNDPQPDHMSKYVKTRSDNGGVHINSGIPNRFYVLTVNQIGLEAALKIWYRVLAKRMIGSYANFPEFTQAVILSATHIDGNANGKSVAAVKKAAYEVGLLK